LVAVKCRLEALQPMNYNGHTPILRDAIYRLRFSQSSASYYYQRVSKRYDCASLKAHEARPFDYIRLVEHSVLNVPFQWKDKELQVGTVHATMRFRTARAFKFLDLINAHDVMFNVKDGMPMMTFIDRDWLQAPNTDVLCEWVK
jgi:hypothetical protein